MGLRRLRSCFRGLTTDDAYSHEGRAAEIMEKDPFRPPLRCSPYRRSARSHGSRPNRSPGPTNGRRDTVQVRAARSLCRAVPRAPQRRNRQRGTTRNLEAGLSINAAHALEPKSTKIASRTNLPRSSASSVDRCCHLMMLDLISSEAGSHQYNLPSPRELPKSRGDQA